MLISATLHKPVHCKRVITAIFSHFINGVSAPSSSDLGIFSIQRAHHSTAVSQKDPGLPSARLPYTPLLTPSIKSHNISHPYQKMRFQPRSRPPLPELKQCGYYARCTQRHQRLHRLCQQERDENDLREYDLLQQLEDRENELLQEIREIDDVWADKEGEFVEREENLGRREKDLVRREDGLDQREKNLVRRDREVEDTLIIGEQSVEDREARVQERELKVEAAQRSSPRDNEGMLPAGWERTEDDRGRTYYANQITKTATWFRPAFTDSDRDPRIARDAGNHHDDGDDSDDHDSVHERTTTHKRYDDHDSYETHEIHKTRRHRSRQSRLPKDSAGDIRGNRSRNGREGNAAPLDRQSGRHDRVARDEERGRRVDSREPRNRRVYFEDSGEI